MASYVLLKYRGNQLQLKFNLELLKRIYETYELQKQGSVNCLEDCFEDLKSAIQKRNKLIGIADKSEAGWNTVNQNLSDDLAEKQP